MCQSVTFGSSNLLTINNYGDQEFLLDSHVSYILDYSVSSDYSFILCQFIGSERDFSMCDVTFVSLQTYIVSTDSIVYLFFMRFLNYFLLSIFQIVLVYYFHTHTCRENLYVFLDLNITPMDSETVLHKTY